MYGFATGAFIIFRLLLVPPPPPPAVVLLLDEGNNEVVVPRPRMYGLIVGPLRVLPIDNEDDVVGFIVADDDDDDVDDDVDLAVLLVLLLVGVSIDLVVASVPKN